MPESMKSKFVPEFSKKKELLVSEYAPPPQPTSIFGSILTLSSSEAVQDVLFDILKKQFKNTVRHLGVEAVARHLFHPLSLKELYQDPQIKKLLQGVGIHPDDPSAEEFLVDTLLDKRVSHELLTTILIRRARSLEAGRGAEVARLAQEGFDLHKEPLLHYLQDRLSLTHEQQELLRQRLNHVSLIQAADPLQSDLRDAEGSYNPTSGVIKISMALHESGVMGPVLIHEMTHALSAPLYRLVSEEIDQDQEGNSIAAELISTTRIGIEIGQGQEKSLRFLNEGVTEILTSLYLSNQEEDLILSSWSDGSSGYSSDAYPDELELCMNMHNPQLLLALTPTNVKKLTNALRRAGEAGILIDEDEFEKLLLKAYLLDEYKEGEPGYAIHWRAWSKKMREYYGDGVLVELSKTWEKQMKGKRPTKQALNACTRLLFQRFLHTWDTASS